MTAKSSCRYFAPSDRPITLFVRALLGVAVKYAVKTPVWEGNCRTVNRYCDPTAQAAPITSGRVASVVTGPASPEPPPEPPRAPPAPEAPPEPPAIPPVPEPPPPDWPPWLLPALPPCPPPLLPPD